MSEKKQDQRVYKHGVLTVVGVAVALAVIFAMAKITAGLY
ncbi:hypothetical protein B0I24_105188 [Aliidiomarina maris]|uniref:Uncharacterized protein n=1 Tax=Aliidiomarina maris TaxID=531312 RepID=A0A327X1K4_9GAMM|nr:hypothetical protein B0I24_105188 [Aliidiomarina maris]